MYAFRESTKSMTTESVLSNSVCGVVESVGIPFSCNIDSSFRVGKMKKKLNMGTFKQSCALKVCLTNGYDHCCFSLVGHLYKKSGNPKMVLGCNVAKVLLRVYWADHNHFLNFPQTSVYKNLY